MKKADQWWDRSWNPITGCSPISEGCAHCYAKGIATRFAGSAGYPKDDPFRVTFHPERLDAPLHWKKPRKIFVCSMGDLFHEDVPFKTVAAIFAVMAGCPQHSFILLTKRPQRAQEFFHWVNKREGQGKTLFPFDGPEWRIWQMLYVEGRKAGADLKPHHGGSWPLPNLWLGVTVENQARADERIPILLQIPAAVRFVSYEPALGPVDFKRYFIRFRCCLCGFESMRPPKSFVCPSCGEEATGNGIYSPAFDWVIVGGETGPGARHMNPEWARSVRDQCREAEVPFWFKKMGTAHPYPGVPEDLLIREYPK